MQKIRWYGSVLGNAKIAYIEPPKNSNESKFESYSMRVKKNGNFELSENFLINEGFIILFKDKIAICCGISNNLFTKELEKRIIDQTDIENVICNMDLSPM